LRFDAGDAIEDHHAAIEHAQAALHLGGEVDVSRRVDQVDLRAPARRRVLPRRRDRGGRDRDAALALLRHPVSDGRAIVHVADAIRAPGIEQHALRQRRLAGVNVGDDADVADLGYGVVDGHKNQEARCKMQDARIKESRVSESQQFL